MNAIRRIVCSFIFAIGMCVFAGSAVALDLGGMVQQLEQTAKQVEHQAAQQPNQQLAVQQQSFAPSFNCAKASIGTEQLICSNSDLSALDVKLSQLYQQVMSKSNDVTSLKKSQNEWRKTKRDACSNVNCLASAYNERVNELSQMLSGSNEPTQLPSNSTDAIQKQAIQEQALQQPIQQQPTTTIPPLGVAIADMKFSEEPTTAQPQSIKPDASPSKLIADAAATEAARGTNEQNNTPWYTTTAFLVFIGVYMFVAALIAMQFVRPPLMTWYSSQSFFISGKSVIDLFFKQIGMRVSWEIFIFFASVVIGSLGGAIIYSIMKFTKKPTASAA